MGSRAGTKSSPRFVPPTIAFAPITNMGDIGLTLGLTGVQRVQLAAHILMSERHLRRVYAGDCGPWAYARTCRGAANLGYPLPPEPRRGRKRVLPQRVPVVTQKTA